MNQTEGISRTLRWIVGTINNHKKTLLRHKNISKIPNSINTTNIEEILSANCSIELISAYLWDPVTEYQIQIFQSAYFLLPWVCLSQWSGVSDCGPEVIYQGTVNTATVETTGLMLSGYFPPTNTWLRYRQRANTYLRKVRLSHNKQTLQKKN